MARKKPLKPYDHYTETVRVYFGGGFLLAIVGIGIMTLAWPSTEISGSSLLEEPIVSESGSAFWVFIGGMVAATGQIMIAIAIIACGVRLGNHTKPVVAAPTS
jgi:hypothetical protein